ncbi:MAG: thymidylate synthase, partial [Myxococcales bacterium]|nr:thymidylate synthase [Myxococcales bacterium]
MTTSRGEQQYLDLLRDVLHNGEHRPSRTGVGVYSVFGRQMRFDLQRGFPAVTTKRLYFHGVVCELLWFLRGDTNTRWLVDHDVHIWDAWADEDG